MEELSGRIAAVLEGGECAVGVESTVLDLAGGGAALLRPGGVLATFCCSHHVDGRLFEDVILSAAYDCRKILRRVANYSQSPDHPVLPSIPETEYLKGYAYEMVG
jgi:23S rRNA G2069 N7-methylase RlmK/C1962 C5-methylase RlmI